MFFKFLRNLLENTCAEASFLIRLQALACKFIEKEAPAPIFSREIANILRAPFLQKTSKRLTETRNSKLNVRNEI